MKVTHNAPPSTQSLETNRAAEKSPARVKGDGESAVSSGVAAHGSNVQISDEARLMRRAQDIVQSVPDVRAERVAALKKSVADGSYKVDAAAVADKLVDDHIATNLGKNGL